MGHRRSARRPSSARPRLRYQLESRPSVLVSGGKAPVPKRIDPDEIDSDDQRIITLKQHGYSDDHVAKKLIEEGRIRYVPKTINSRWLRLRKAADKKEDDRLDDELSDWHIGEVGLLTITTRTPLTLSRMLSSTRATRPSRGSSSAR